jgi:chromosome segregation ATPase
LKRLNAETEELLEQVDSLDQALSAAKEEVIKHATLGAAKLQDIEVKYSQLEEKNQEIEARNQEIKARNQEMEARNQELVAKINKAEMFECKTQALEQTVGEQADKFKQFEEQISILNSNVTEKEVSVGEMVKEIHEKAELIAKLENQIQEFQTTNIEALDKTDKFNDQISILNSNMAEKEANIQEMAKGIQDKAMLIAQLEARIQEADATDESRIRQLETEHEAIIEAFETFKSSQIESEEQLKFQLDERSHLLQSLEDQVKELSEKLVSAQHQISNKEHIVEQLSQNNQEEQVNQTKEFQDQINQLESKNQVFIEDLEKFKSKCDSLKEQVTVMTGEITEKEDAFEVLKSEMTSNEVSRVKEFDLQIQELKETIHVKQVHLSDVQESLKQLEESNKQEVELLKSQCDSLKEQVTVMTQEMTEKEDAFEFLTSNEVSRVKEFDLQIQELKETIQVKEVKLTEVQESIKQLEESNKQEIELLKSKLELRESDNQVQDQLDIKLKELKEAQVTIDESKQKFSEIEAENTEIKSSFNALNQEFESTKQNNQVNLVDIQSKCDYFEDQVIVMTEEITEKEVAFEALKSEMTSNEVSRVKEFDLQIQELKETIKVKEAHLSHVQESLKQLQESNKQATRESDNQFQDQLDIKLEELKELDIKLEELKGAQVTIEESKQKFSELKAENTEIKNSFNSLNQELESTKQNNRVKLEEKQENEVKLLNELDNFKSCLNHDCSTLKSNVENLAENIKETKSESKTFQSDTLSEFNSLQKLFNQLNSTVISQEDYKTELLDEIREMTTELKQRSSKISNNEEEIEALKSKLKSEDYLKHDLKLAQDEVEKLNKKLEQQQQKQNKLQQHHDEAQSEAMSTSTVSKVEETSRMADVESSFEDRFDNKLFNNS